MIGEAYSGGSRSNRPSGAATPVPVPAAIWLNEGRSVLVGPHLLQ